MSKNWSPYQRAIFEDVASGKGHTVIQARAGSGKTTTILEAMNFIPAGMTAIFMAFNKSIADELATRAPRGVAVSTLHSYGNRAVVNAYGRLKLDTRRVESFAAAIVGDERSKWGQRRALAKCVSLCKNTLAATADEVDFLIDEFGLELADIERDDFIAHTLSLLESCKNTSDDRIDFDDMIWLPVVNGLRLYQYDHVFVDEQQDLNPCQFQLIKQAIKKSGRLCGVGDNRQAIYQFRGSRQGIDGQVHRGVRREVAAAQHHLPLPQARRRDRSGDRARPRSGAGRNRWCRRARDRREVASRRTRGRLHHQPHQRAARGALHGFPARG